MTRFDEILGNKKEEIKRKNLKLILDEGDEILFSISRGMIENNLIKAKLENITGFLLSGVVLDDKTSEKIEVFDKEIISANAIFSLTNGDLWGTLNIFIDKVKPITGKLIKGTAKEGTQIVLSFEEKDIKRPSKIWRFFAC